MASASLASMSSPMNFDDFVDMLHSQYAAGSTPVHPWWSMADDEGHSDDGYMAVDDYGEWSEGYHGIYEQPSGEEDGNAQGFMWPTSCELTSTTTSIPENEAYLDWKRLVQGLEQRMNQELKVGDIEIVEEHSSAVNSASTNTSRSSSHLSIYLGEQTDSIEPVVAQSWPSPPNSRMQDFHAGCDQIEAFCHAAVLSYEVLLVAKRLFINAYRNTHDVMVVDLVTACIHSGCQAAGVENDLDTTKWLVSCGFGRRTKSRSMKMLERLPRLSPAEGH